MVQIYAKRKEILMEFARAKFYSGQKQKLEIHGKRLEVTSLLRFSTRVLNVER